MGWESRIPPQAVPYIYELLAPYRVDVYVARARRTKTGDFRPGRNGHRISVNGNLNTYHFLWVLVHEIAHLHVHERYKRRIAPHGPEWKQAFKELMWPLSEEEWLPEELRPIWQRHLHNPKATTFSDQRLIEAFRAFDPETEAVTTVSMLRDGEEFTLSNGRQFRRGPKQRTRYKCREISTGRWYLVQGLAPIVDRFS